MPLLSTLQVSKAVNANQHSHMSDFAEMSYFQPLHIWTDLSVLTSSPKGMYIKWTVLVCFDIYVTLLKVYVRRQSQRNLFWTYSTGSTQSYLSLSQGDLVGFSLVNALRITTCSYTGYSVGYFTGQIAVKRKHFSYLKNTVWWSESRPHFAPLTSCLCILNVIGHWWP